MNLIYEVGQGPIDISVVDPVKVPKGTFILKLEDPTLTTGSSAGAITSYKKWSIIDEETGSLHLCRDRFGEKPLYWFRDKKGGFFFQKTYIFVLT